MSKSLKQNNSTDRFLGNKSDADLTELFCQCKLVVFENRKLELVKDLIKNSEFIKNNVGVCVINQSDEDNDLYVLLKGEVNVIINGRVIAKRISGDHFGEMAMIDSTSRRSATIKTTQTSLLAKITKNSFTKLSKVYPSLWQSVSIELSRRLSERSRFITTPNPNPVLFIGSSSEGLKIAERVQKSMTNKGIITKLWKDNVFSPSSTFIESLESIITIIDFGLIILTPDDITVSRGKKNQSPRDNAIFELGLCIGALKRQRVFFLVNSGTDVKIPSDLLGVNWLEYQYVGGKYKISKAVECIAGIIKQLNVK
ncbi:MAG: nucleotide-binding protein [bacterium]|nr:nucleotide-binding protein [bacterium]